MSVSLSISITEGTHDETTNSTLVYIDLTVSYDSNSWNALGTANGTLNVNGASYSFTTSFNKGQTSGSEVVYSKTLSIDRNVTDTVNCTATFKTGQDASSMTVSANKSRTLSGGSSGGDSGGSGGGYEGGGDGYVDPDTGTVMRPVTFVVGEHTSIKYSESTTNYIVVTENTTVRLYPRDNPVEVIFIPDDGYSLIECSIDGEPCDSVGYFNTPGDGNEVMVISHAIPTGAVRIDSGTEYRLYQCYIETKHFERDIYSSDCIFEGYASTSSSTGGNLYYYTGQTFQVGSGSTAFLKFTTPDYTGVPTNLTIAIGMSGSYRLALLSSDTNWNMYIGHANDVTTDEYQILSCEIDETRPVVVPITEIESNATYYFVIWEGSVWSSDVVAGNSIKISLDSTEEPDPDHPDYFIKHDLYIPYIDNGTSWEIYH